MNAACVRAGKPLVSGAALRFDGQVAVFDARDANAPCYHCLFGEGDELEETRCATMGVFAPLVGIVGATQAAEALKLLAGVGRVARRPPAARRRACDANGASCACRAIRRVPCARTAGHEPAEPPPRCRMSRSARREVSLLTRSLRCVASFSACSSHCRHSPPRRPASPRCPPTNGRRSGRSSTISCGR